MPTILLLAAATSTTTTSTSTTDLNLQIRSANQHDPVALLVTDLLWDETNTNPRRLNWDSEWSRFRMGDYAFSLGLLSAISAIKILMPRPPHGWQRGVLFDDYIEDLLRVDDTTTRENMSLASDILQDTAYLYPVLIDAGLVSLWLEDNPDLAWQLLMMDLEAYFLATFLVVVTKHTVGRVRPDIRPCDAPDDFSCRSNASRRSFFSGHTTAGFTAAGLVCVQHHHIPLYGSTAADTAACLGMLALAVTNGILRIPSNQHYATDVAVGAVVGLFSGALVPYLLHFTKKPEGQRKRGALELTALAGIVRDGANSFAAGGEASVRQIFWLEDSSLGLEASLQGQMIRTTTGGFLQQTHFTTRLWAHYFAAGFFIDYRSQSKMSEDFDLFSAGPTIAVGIPFGDQQHILLSGRWAPLFEGSSRLWAARLEGALFDWLTLSAEAQNLRSPDDDNDGNAFSGVSFLLGVGGRLAY